MAGLVALPALMETDGLSQDTSPDGNAGGAPGQSSAAADTSDRESAGKKSDAAEKDRKPLFIADEFPKGWHYHPAEDGVAIEDTWQVQHDAGVAEPFLRCLGKPYGYLRTKEVYDNYEFGLKWRYPSDPNGNSGILLHTSGKDQIWPASVQIQLHRPRVGHVFASSGAKADNRLEVKIEPRDLNVWNECLVTCLDGRISVTINRKKVGEVTGCTPAKGMIGLQSEGSEIHFGSIWIRKLPPRKTA